MWQTVIELDGEEYRCIAFENGPCTEAQVFVDETEGMWMTLEDDSLLILRPAQLDRAIMRVVKVEEE